MLALWLGASLSWATEFSDAEREWLAAHPVIRVGSDPRWPPISFLDAKGHVVGVDADLLKAIGARLGVRFETQPTESWEDTWRRFADRELDMTTATALTPERESIADFTTAYASFPVAVITRDDAPFLIGLRALHDKTLAAPAEHVTTARIRREFPNMKFLMVEDSVEALRRVARGDADFAVENLAIASHIIRTRGYANLKIAGLTDYRFDLRFAVRRDWPEWTSILNKTLADLSEDTRNRILDRWIPVNYEDAINWQSVWRGVQWLASLALLAVVLIFVHNRRLADELAERRRMQAALRQREAELSASNEQLKRINEEKDMLMHMAAHDLNNPLTAVMFAAEMVDRDHGDRLPDVRNNMGYIRENADRMMRLTRNLLQIDALENNPASFTIAPVDLCTVITRVCHRHQRVAAQKSITIGLAQQTVPLPLINGNDDALDQVFDNLIANAIKYTPPGGNVSVQLSRLEGRWRVEVRDQGPGIRNEDMPRLFRKFERLGAHPTGGEKSTGLGLAIVKRLVESMQGRVSCESEPGRGACFVVEFPAAGSPGEPRA